MTKVQNFIGGELVDSVSGATMPLVDPSTGEEYATAPISNEQDIDNAYGRCQGIRRLEAHPQIAPAKALLVSPTTSKNAQALVEAEGRNTGKPNHVTMAEEIPPMVDQIGSSPVRQGCWRASRQASTWRTTRRGSAVSRSGSSVRWRRGTTR